MLTQAYLFPDQAPTPCLRSLLKWHGGKSYLARRIVLAMPPHETYVEPFAGGAAVLLRKPPVAREVLGDIDPELMRFYRTLQARPAELFARVQALPYSPETFERAGCLPMGDTDDLAAAVAFLVRNRMSRGALGTAFGRPGAGKDRLRGKRHPGGSLPDNESAWRSLQDALPVLARRLRAVELFLGDALDLIRRHDRPGVLIYCDPPYEPSTRTARKAYRFEMTVGDHARLLEVLIGLKQAAVMLSGYRCELYDAALSGWRRLQWDMPNHAGQGRAKERRTECLWQRP